MEKEFLIQHPLLKIKKEGDKKFDLSDPQERREYFEFKAGPEIARLKEYLSHNTFIAYLLGKKNSGKGTYTKLMMEIFGEGLIGHISIGDIVRHINADMADEVKKKELLSYLDKNYRGYISADEAIKTLLDRNTKTLLPSEFILALAKKEIDLMPKKSLFIDGFPRDLDQISYALYFKNLIDYRNDPDVFVAIDIPESVISERMQNRVVCPKCHTPRSLNLLPTKKISYDSASKEFYLVCDNSACENAKMTAKEGDTLGIEAIRARLELDGRLIDKIFTLHGVPKILLRNSVPVNIVAEYFNDYEITPEYHYELDADGNIKVETKSWIIKDDKGNDAHSLLAPPVVVMLIKQLVDILR